MSSISGGDDEPTAAEWAVMAVSVLVTLSLFGYVAWHATTTPADATPEAAVTGLERTEDGRIVVTIEVHNPGGTGLQSVTVSADCTDESITFEHVPIDATRTGTVVCPPGSDDPSASILSWIEA